MKTVSYENLYIRDPKTGEITPFMAIRGESAYDIAVKLGTFTGTEEEWNNYIKTERNAALAAIDAKLRAALEIIPDDLEELHAQIDSLGRIQISSAEPSDPSVDLWVDTDDDEEIFVVTADDIAQELGDAEDKVLSQKAAKEGFDKISEEIGSLQENTRNLWTFGDKTFTRFTPVYFDPPIPAGTYTLSALISSDAAGLNCFIEFIDTENNQITTAYIDRSDSERKSTTFTLTSACAQINIFSGRGSSVSVGYTATYSKVQLEQGEAMTDYIPPVTTADFVARENAQNVHKEIKKLRDDIVAGVDGKLPLHFSVSGDLSDGGSLYDAKHANSIRSNERIVFNADITSFASLEIGFAWLHLGYKYNRFVIDDTNLTVYGYTGAQTVHQHGLTFVNNIQVIIESNEMRTCKISIISNGSMYTVSDCTIDRRRVVFPYVQSVGSVLPNAKLSWTCTDFNKSVWIFGDSYVAGYTDKWFKYAYQNGYTKNCLFDAYGGEGSADSIESFMNLLEIAKPKTVVWCLGMNDGGDTDDTPSSGWATVQNTLRSLCRDKNIELVLATIPTVPTINHEAKNANIRESGYRYIDFAKAVGANAFGVWYGNMLSSDGVHPADDGAKALYGRILLDLPEIMITA